MLISSTIVEEWNGEGGMFWAGEGPIWGRHICFVADNAYNVMNMRDYNLSLKVLGRALIFRFLLSSSLFSFRYFVINAIFRACE